jgi:hypothetical protein
MVARILGIDPGLSGAIALLTSAGGLQVEDVPVLQILGAFYHEYSRI